MVFPFWIHLRRRAEVGVQRRDFPTWKCWIIFWRSGIIRSERNYWKPRVYAGFAACFVARAFSLLSALEHKENTMRKADLRSWRLSFPFLLCAVTHFIILTPVCTEVYGSFKPICLRDLFLFFFFLTPLSRKMCMFPFLHRLYSCQRSFVWSSAGCHSHTHTHTHTYTHTHSLALFTRVCNALVFYHPSFYRCFALLFPAKLLVTIQFLSINKPHLAGCKQTLGHSSRFVRRASGISVITYAAIAASNSPVAIIMMVYNSAERQKKLRTNWKQLRTEGSMLEPPKEATSPSCRGIWMESWRRRPRRRWSQNPVALATCRNKTGGRGEEKCEEGMMDGDRQGRKWRCMR